MAFDESNSMGSGTDDVPGIANGIKVANHVFLSCRGVALDTKDGYISTTVASHVGHNNSMSVAVARSCKMDQNIAGHNFHEGYGVGLLIKASGIAPFKNTHKIFLKIGTRVATQIGSSIAAHIGVSDVFIVSLQPEVFVVQAHGHIGALFVFA